MFRDLPLFLLFSIIATLLLPTSSRHVNFNTLSVLEGKKNSATVKIADQGGNLNAQGHRRVDYVLMACDERQNCSSGPTRSPGSDSADGFRRDPRERESPSHRHVTSVYIPAPLLSPLSSVPTSITLPPSSPPPLLPTSVTARPSSLPPTVPSLPPRTPPSGNHQIWKWIGIASAVIGVLLMCITIYYFRYELSVNFCLTTNSDPRTEEFLKNHELLAKKRYTLLEVKKMTNSFNDNNKLGQGGFGTVYKGKLPNGDLAAVKLLNTSKGNGEDFINEVDSISRTSHVNVVTLLGFCLEGRKKALIYEFMPNGSLDNFIYNKGPETIASLSWENSYQIAIGIARGLEYLHRGCNTRILHFDIKPHNILLDENFCPKISDFGLAKLCPKNESIISMSNARGTIGYAAPEVWNRHFGGVSHKSDVYSYGMMLLEMVGGRNNINAEASHTSEIYFPHWAYNRLELDSDLRLNEVMTPEENKIAKRLTIVGLWCIQTFPNDRPTMGRVIDMLEGSMNSLEMPPKPLLSSPTRSVSKSSISRN